MSMSEIKRFYQEVSKNEKLRKEMEKISESLQGIDPSQIEQVFKEKIEPKLKEAGFNFTYQDLLDFEASVRPNEDGELSDDALEAAAGGKANVCVIGGGGKHGDSSTVCAVVGSTDWNAKSVADAGCACVVVGVSF